MGELERSIGSVIWIWLAAAVVGIKMDLDLNLFGTCCWNKKTL